MKRLSSWLPAASGVAAGLGVALWGEAPLPALVGVPLVLAGAAWWLWPAPDRARQAWERIAERRGVSWGVAVVGLVALVCAVYWPLAQGHMPWAAGQADHPTHLYQAWLLVEHMLPSGRLTGWSDMRWAGYPALELYPIGGALWVALFRLVTFGSLDWEATYALAILGMLVLNVVAVYVAARRFVGPWAALVAALLVLFERGWPRQGGDHYAVDVGVWPVTLGVAPMLLCLERLWAWVTAEDQKQGRWALVGAAAFAGWALLCHPLYLPVLALALPTVALVGALSGERSWRAVLGVVAVFLLGLGLVAFWYAPFLDGRWLTEPGGAPFRSLGNLGEGLVMGSMLPSFWPLAALAALVGTLVALRRGGGAAVPAALGLVLLLAASATPLELSERLSRMTGSLQQERFLIVVRVLSCVMAGYAAAFVVAAARRKGGEGGVRSRFAAALVVGLLGTLAWPAAEGLLKHQVAEVVDFDHGPGLEHRRDLLAMCRWMRQQAGDESPRPRTAWYVGYGRHEYNSAPVYCGLPQIIDTPAETWASRPGGISEREVRAFGVRWVVGDRPIEGRDSYLRLARAFGRLHVYEVRDYGYSRITSLGAARAELIRFEDELIRARISDAEAGDRVVVHVSRHPGWHATLDGEPQPIAGGHLGLPRADLMHVPVPHDGVLELRYEPGGPRVNGVVLSILALLGLAAIALSGRWAPRVARHAVWQRATDGWARLPAPARLASGVLVVAAVVLVPVLLGGRSPATADPDAPERPEGLLLADRLDDAVVWRSRGRQRRLVPRRWDGRFGQRLPPRVVVDRHVEAIELGDPRRIVAVRPEAEEAVGLRLDVGPVRGVAGFIARGGRGQRQTAVEVRLGGRRVGRAEVDALGQWGEVEVLADRPASPLELIVTTEGPPGRAVLLDLVAVE